MTNPSPRPALRKAADSDIHPAAPRPARSSRPRTDPAAAAPVGGGRGAASPSSEPVTVAPTGAPVAPLAPLKQPKKAHAESGRTTKPPKRKFSGSTTDHLRVPEVPDAGNGGSAQRSALDALFDGDAAPAPKPHAAKSKASTDGSKAPADKPRKGKAPTGPVDLMGGKVVDLGARVPKALRKAARDQARDRGLDVDTVVTDLLHTWIVGHR